VAVPEAPLHIAASDIGLQRHPFAHPADGPVVVEFVAKPQGDGGIVFHAAGAVEEVIANPRGDIEAAFLLRDRRGDERSGSQGRGCQTSQFSSHRSVLLGRSRHTLVRRELWTSLPHCGVPGPKATSARFQATGCRRTTARSRRGTTY